MIKTVRERASRYGVEALFDIEAFSLLTNIKEESLKEFSSIKQLKEGYLQLQLTEVQKQKLEAFFELAKRIGKQDDRAINKVTSPSDVYSLVKWDMVELQKEEFRIILLNAKCKVISVKMISQGSLTASIVHPREVFKEAILHTAHSFIAVHNHPSGDTVPSREDIQITERLKKCGEMLGIPLRDHVIVSSRGYTSLKEESYL